MQGLDRRCYGQGDEHTFFPKVLQMVAHARRECARSELSIEEMSQHLDEVLDSIADDVDRVFRKSGSLLIG